MATAVAFAAREPLTAANLAVGVRMSSYSFTLVVAVVMFAAGLLGLLLQRVLPEEHTTGGSRDMIAAIAGLLTLLCALVAGLLIWTAYGVYSGQNLQIQAVASKVMQLDLALADYGPEAMPLRAELEGCAGKDHRSTLACSTRAMKISPRDNFASALENMRARDKALAKLHPTTDDQKQALAAANSASDALGQARMQMSFALSAPVAYPVLLTVVGWVACLFCGFGLTARGTVTSVIALAVGSIAIASAVLLILDLSDPYSGIVRASPRPLGAGARGHGQGVTPGRPSEDLARIHHPVRVERRLDLAHHGERSGVLPAREQSALELTHAVFGGIRAAEARDDSVHDLVHRVPAIEKGLLVGADRLRHVEVDIAVAEMAEGDDAGPRLEGFDRRRRLPDQGRHEADRDGHVVLDRAALLALRVRQALAQLPEIRALLERGGDRSVLDDARLERRLERAGEGFVESARASAMTPR